MQTFSQTQIKHFRQKIVHFLGRYQAFEFFDFINICFWMLRDEINSHFRDLGVVELGFGLAIKTAIFQWDGWIVRAGPLVTAVSWADMGRFFKSAPNVLKTSRKAYLGAKKFFPLQSADYHGESLDYPGSWFWVCGESDQNFSKVHQKTYWYFKTLIWARKKFATMGPDYSHSWFLDYSELKMIFFKNSPNGLLIA